MNETVKLILSLSLSGSILAGLLFAVKPVSYTHLDVYKRQDLASHREHGLSGKWNLYYCTGHTTPETRRGE